MVTQQIPDLVQSDLRIGSGVGETCKEESKDRIKVALPGWNLAVSLPSVAMMMMF